ncbi:electron transfer flavoprotein subunit alpha/FixB family protein [Aureibaculum conchae]|uniref:electron transfer flavoprotein subunit alpha/FixB family protein n=1 Tax=Aureibaculum sp. 2308TA14-22 TaxID=3108392 RepID=UPI0033973C1F
MKILVIAEAQGKEIRHASRSAITLAKNAAAAANGEIEIAIIGDDIEAAATAASAYAPTFTLSDASLANATADRYGAAIAKIVEQRGASLVIAASTSQGKDCVARAAASLGGTMVTDAIACENRDGKLVWQRTMHAGGVAAWVVAHGSPVVVTALQSAYEPAEPTGETSVTALEIDVASLPSAIQFESVSTKQSDRPDVTEAAVVISGGRAFKTAEDYEQLIGGLADKVGGGTGSSRAAVDAGIAPNENQVGQTGKIIAPDLYLGIGISGAVQHLAGMKNSKIIAAINTDDEAPLLDYADFALIADAYDAIPELIDKL